MGCYHPSATLPACSRKVAHLRLVQLQLFPVLRRSAWDLRAAAAAATREVARILLRANSGLPTEDPERQSLACDAPLFERSQERSFGGTAGDCVTAHAPPSISPFTRAAKILFSKNLRHTQLPQLHTADLP